MPEKATEYWPRSVKTWLERLSSGSLALPRFQRSYVWTDKKISDLLLALFQGRPVGTLLLIDRYSKTPPENTPPTDLRPLERFAARSLSGTETALAPCTELILDGQQRLTSLWRALELGLAGGLKDTEPHGRHAFLRVADIHAPELQVQAVDWPKASAALEYLDHPATAAGDHLIPLRLFDPKGVDSTVDLDSDRLLAWCGTVCDNQMREGHQLWRRIDGQLRAVLLARNIWYAKLPRHMPRRDAITVFIKVNESSAVIKKFDIAVAEFDAMGGTETSLRQRISSWAERSTHSERFFGADEEEMIPQVGELILKIACLQEDKIPTDKHFTSEPVLKRLHSDASFSNILLGIEWTFEFLEEECIWKDKHLPSKVPLQVLSALFPDYQTLADASDMEGRTRRCLRAYLWRSFVTDRYSQSANTRLQQDFLGLRGVLGRLTGIQDLKSELRKDVPIFKDAFRLPTLRQLHDLDDPLAPPTRKNSLSRSLLVVSLKKGAMDFGSGQPVSRTNISAREAHHLFPKKFLKDAFSDSRIINHCMNYALVSGPTNKRIAAKAPIQYLMDRYKTDSGLDEDELRERVESHLIPFGALAIQKRRPATAYRTFVKERARMLRPVIVRLADGKPI